MNIIAPLQSALSYGKQSQPLPGQNTPSSPVQPEAGQLLKATVVDSFPDNRILLQIGDSQFSARSEVPVKAGQTLQLQLTSTSPQLEFKIVGDTLQQFLGRPLTLLGNTIDISSLYKLLKQDSTLLGTLSSNSKQTLDTLFSLQQGTLNSDSGGAAIKQLIDGLGLSFESFLSRGDANKASSTLKAALMEILQNIKGGNAVTETATKTLTTLEFFQLSQLHADLSQQLIFPIPLSFVEQGFLLIEQRQDEQQGSGSYDDQEYRFSLHLKMTDIGNLRIDFFHSAEGLFIRFYTDSHEKAQFIESFSEELKKTISDTPILGLSFATGAEDPALELLRLMVPEGKPVLDTRA